MHNGTRSFAKHVSTFFRDSFLTEFGKTSIAFYRLLATVTILIFFFYFFHCISKYCSYVAIKCPCVNDA